jgi:hypothetical protein
MIRVTLDSIIKLLEQERFMKGPGPGGGRVSLGEVSEKTGIHRNILSRIVNKPAANTSSEHIGKLAEFFFYEFLKLKMHEKWRCGEVGLMANVISRLIAVFPEQGEHQAFIKKLGESGEVDELPMSRIWEFYASSHPQSTEAEFREDIKTKRRTGKEKKVSKK